MRSLSNYLTKTLLYGVLFLSPLFVQAQEKLETNLKEKLEKVLEDVCACAALSQESNAFVAMKTDDCRASVNKVLRDGNCIEDILDPLSGEVNLVFFSIDDCQDPRAMFETIKATQKKLNTLTPVLIPVKNTEIPKVFRG